jgi:predicted RNase H-like HicB family nuclease
MNPIPITLERSEGAFYARIADIGDFMLVTYGETIAEIEINMRELIIDYLENEGKNDVAWRNIDAQTLQFIYNYDVQAFFEAFNALKITEVAQLSGLNASLLRQYAAGVKHPSEAQAKRIEQAVHILGHQLTQVVVI